MLYNQSRYCKVSRTHAWLYYACVRADTIELQGARFPQHATYHPFGRNAATSHIVRLRIFVPTSLCAHVSICPKKLYFVPTSLCAHVSICPKKSGILCPRLFVPTSLYAPKSGILFGQFVRFSQGNSNFQTNEL